MYIYRVKNGPSCISLANPRPNKLSLSIIVVEVSDDEGGFVTDSELEINRSTRYGSLVSATANGMVSRIGCV